MGRRARSGGSCLVDSALTDARWNGYLSNVPPAELHARYVDRLPESMLGRDFLTRYGEHVDAFTLVEPERWYPVRAAARYASEEHLRIDRARSLLSQADLARRESHLHLLGELMEESHRAYAECGLGAPECDVLVQLARKHGLWGAKMTGGGGGGVVALLGTPDQERAVDSLAAEYAQHRGARPAIFAGSSNGADRAGVACWGSEITSREAVPGAGLR